MLSERREPDAPATLEVDGSRNKTAGRDIREVHQHHHYYVPPPEQRRAQLAHQVASIAVLAIVSLVGSIVYIATLEERQSAASALLGAAMLISWTSVFALSAFLWIRHRWFVD